MTLGEFKKVLTVSGSSALTLGSLCPQMAQTQRIHSASCPHDSTASAAASSAFPALKTYDDDEEKDSF